MVTVLREGGFRIVIYLDDHAPAHVHAFGSGEIKITLGAVAGEVAVTRTIGTSRAESRRAVRIVRERHDVLLRRWTEMHG